MFLNVLDDLGSGIFRGVETETAGGTLVRFDRFQDVLFALLAESSEIAELSFSSEFFDVGDSRGLKIRPQESAVFRSERLQIQDVEQRDWIFLQQLLAKT